MIKILFADDDLKYSMLLKSFLQQHGYDVTYAGNGMKAWEQLSTVLKILTRIMMAKSIPSQSYRGLRHRTTYQ